MPESPLAKALLEFQKDAPSLHKASEGQFGKYLGLEDLVGAIRPKLNEQGVIFTQGAEPMDGHLWLKTTLTHVGSGDTASFSVPLTEPTNMQALGSALTYARRYCLVAALGLVADEDDDGRAASRSEPQREAEKASEAQVTKLAILRKEAIDARLYESEEEFRERLHQFAGVHSLRDLGKDDASRLITTIQGRLTDRQEVPI